MGVIVGAVVFASLFAWNNLNSKSEEPQQNVTVTITKGMSGNQIGNLLQNKRVIKNALVFRVLIRKQGVESDFKPGDYNLKTNMDYDEVIKTLIAGPPITYVDVTFPEGWTAKKIANRIGSTTRVNKDDYLDIISSGQIGLAYPFLTNNGAPTKNLEGYLYPQTYRVEKDTTPDELVIMQLSEFQKQTASLNWDNARLLGKTPYQIMIIASLIERETRVKSERPIVASVIYNRLKKNMRLQIDATVQYALPEWKERLSYDDLKVESPYNTYKYAGLPPGPICNPGYSSIEAALNPTTTDYLYYVLGKDNTGSHVFAKTYNEFLEAKAQYRTGRRELEQQQQQNQRQVYPQYIEPTETTDPPLN